MKYYKNLNANCIQSLSVGVGGVEITEDEYNQILDVIKNKPVDVPGYYFKLTVDLQWEKTVREPVTEEYTSDDLTAEKKLTKIKEVYA